MAKVVGIVLGVFLISVGVFQMVEADTLTSSAIAWMLLGFAALALSWVGLPRRQ